MSNTIVANFPPSREEGLRRLQSFIERAGKYYTEHRNYDFGPQERQNVSGLSPYLRHRLITEEEVVRSVLAHHSYKDAQKFIEEICWRTYWKGWLEHKPQVWKKYQEELDQIKNVLENNLPLKVCYEKAITGTTEIEAFNTWVKELIEFGYLHNHARMWFASIWIFTLHIPWVLGANFFFEHLLDGDPASNILSWRWVAGLQTRGKAYIANADNIYRFTGGRFHPLNQLVETPQPTHSWEDEGQEIIPCDTLDAPASFSKSVVLLITEEDLSPETWGLPRSAVRGVVAIGPTPLSPHQSQKVSLFRKAALQETLVRCQKFFGTSTIFLEEAEEHQLISLLRSKEVSEVVTATVPVGPTRERMEKLLPSLRSSQIRMIEKRRVWDQLFWPYTTAGYFKLKNRIEDILEGLIA